MTAPDNETRSILERLERVEKQNRHLRRGLVVAVLLMGSVLFMGYTSFDEQLKGLKNLHVTQLDAQQIAIRDAAGQLRAWFGYSENETKIMFFDENNRQRAGFGITAHYEPSLSISDGDNNQRIVLGMVEGWPGLVIRDAVGQKRVALHARDNWATLSFFDRREKRRASVGINQKEASALELLDDTATDRAGLTTDNRGTSLVFFDRAGKKRAGFGIGREDDPAIGFFNQEGRPEVSITAFNAMPDVSLYGTNQIETSMCITTNGPQMQVFGTERRVIWQTP